MAASSAGSSTDMSDRLYGAWVSVVNIGYGPSSPRTARTRSHGTSYWSWNAPILGASTKGTRPSRAFLSRVIAARTRSASIAGARTGRPRAARSRSWRRTVPFPLGEVVGVEHDAMLDDFGGPRFEFARRQRERGRGITDDQARLVEGADQVLRRRVVDRGLAADRGVHLGEHRRGKLDEVDAAHVGRRDEPGDVAHGSPAEGEHRGGAVEPGGEQRVPAARGHGERLRGLALGHLDRRHHEPRALEAPPDGLAVETQDRGVADERRSGAHAELREARAHRVERAGLDHDAIRPEAQVEVDDHRGHSTAPSLAATAARARPAAPRGPDVRPAGYQLFRLSR